jgi:pyruvate dehydrogenase E2 component (dihydrolipoamide acetyltransferase)
MYEFRMPSLGADMEAGTLVEWLKRPGDSVARGDIVAVVETDKGAIEIEIFVTGKMGKQVVALGTKVPVGTTLALIEGVTDEAAQTVVAPHAEASVSKGKPVSITPPPSVSGVPSEGLRASPAARKMAQERGVDLSTVKGTGPAGSIVLHDVERAIALPAHRGLDLNKMRQAIAAAMARSKREIPHYYLATDIDMSKSLAWLQTVNAGRTPGDRLLPAALTLKSVALAARSFPNFNGSFNSATGFVPATGVHLGVAVAIRGGGLAAPAIHGCDQLSLDELMAKLRDLVARTRDGRLRSSEMSDATLTVSSLGERGVETLYGVIYPPQVAIIGFGKITSRAVANDGQLSAREVVTISLAGDHRVTDGHLGSRFLRDIGTRLQEPEKL